jgi:hypothetical protein
MEEFRMFDTSQVSNSDGRTDIKAGVPETFLEKIRASFTNPSENWCPFPENNDLIGRGVYFIRLKGTGAIPRWMDRDDCRILYIGRSKRKRVKHPARRRLKTLEKYCPKVPEGQRLECEYFLVKENGKEERALMESFLLLSYYFHFGDRPPQNRNLERCYLRQEGKGKKEVEERENSVRGTWLKIKAILKGHDNQTKMQLRPPSWLTLSE